jgi:hypothetical protein
VALGKAELCTVRLANMDRFDTLLAFIRHNDIVEWRRYMR